MKKIYQAPETNIVGIELAGMIAGSAVGLYGKYASGEGLSRRGHWDDEEFEMEERKSLLADEEEEDW